MKLLGLFTFILQALAVTALPALLLWWWNGTTNRARNNLTAYFWTFIIVVGLLGIAYQLLTQGGIGVPPIPPGY